MKRRHARPLRRRPSPRGRLALCACLGLLAAGCGSDDEGEPIPSTQAETINSRLDEVERRLEAGGGACGDIQDDSIPALEQAVGQIPDDVDNEVQDALEQSVARLAELTSDQCDEQAGQDTTPEPAPAPVPPVTQEPPPQTQTQPPQTQTREQRPPQQDGDEGEGEGGDGSGPGGGDGGGVPNQPIDPRD